MNNFSIYKIRSQFIKKLSIIMLSLLTVSFVGFKFLNLKTIEAFSISPHIPSDEERVLELTNIQRAKNNTPSLAWDYSLYLAARSKAYHMLKYDYFEHTAPNGTTPWDFIKGTGYNYTVAGENLAIDFYNFNDLVDAWMSSPAHKDNILDKDFANIGIAIIKGDFNGHDSIIVVQMFGYPDAP